MNQHKNKGISLITLIIEVSQTNPDGIIFNAIKMFQFSQFIASLTDSLSRVIPKDMLQ